MFRLSADEKFRLLTDKVLEIQPGADIALIKKAWAFCKLAHTGQKRMTGEAFANHPLATAVRLADWKLDVTTIVAALLHDTIEDGGATRQDIIKGFGRDVYFLVYGVTKITGLRLKGSREAEFTENLRKMLLVMAKDLRVVLLKLADRLHNMETLYALSPEKRLTNSRETLEIYAPLAERLGMGRIKGELEDLAFPYVFPEEYKRVFAESKPYYKEAEEDINKMKKRILKELAKDRIKAQVHGRKKHLYSLWYKLQRAEINGDYDNVHDIVALRILVDTIAQCYGVLGNVHGLYKPVPRIGISDFIAQPKPNGYRSIHTKVFGSNGRIVEVQVRTYQMHEEAEYGVAAHWAYSEQKEHLSDTVREKMGGRVAKEKLPWMKQLVAWQKELVNSEDFLKAVKFDALRHRNFVFSPLGDVYDLPTGATPVDFAYAVHTDLGREIAGAKVDGRMVPLDYKLSSGQVVEIIKAKNPKNPNPDWLEFVATQLARREINKYLRRQE